MIYRKDKEYGIDIKIGLVLLVILLIALLVGCQCKEDEGTRSDVKQLVCTE